jgi:hypothetical protein
MIAEQRIGPDRRCRPTPLLSRYSVYGGRRASIRRTTDLAAVYVDRLGMGISLILLFTFLFHCLDAVFTLSHLARGGKELNPFMDYLLRIGPGAFVIGKLSLAGVGLCFLGLHKNFPLVKAGIAALFLLYAGVIGYHVFLILGS